MCTRGKLASLPPVSAAAMRRGTVGVAILELGPRSGLSRS
jgi:hypothetical protein